MNAPMNRVWVKICGITNIADALSAAQTGADAIGFNLIPTSPRGLERGQVAEILPSIPSSLTTVAVVANESYEFLKGLLRVCPVKAFQFHGNESPEEVLALKGEAKLIKAIRVRDAQSLQEIPRYQGVDAILLDTFQPDKLGGTGASFDWSLAAQATQFGIPIILAGGLTPANVADAITQAHPYGVDVASGVELSPGRKDAALVRDFILRAKALS